MFVLAFTQMVLINLVVQLLHTHVSLFLSLHKIFLQVCAWEYIFLSLLIPRPKSLGKSLDIEVNTFGIWKKQNFKMKAILLWTIRDFPAYGMLSSWSTHGKIVCPYCIKHNKSFVLKHGRKCCWFDCHHQYLPLEHSFHHDRYFLKNSTIERSLPPPQQKGIEIMSRVSQLKDFNFGLNSYNENNLDLGKFTIG
ncbi:hypothetical protein CR513_18290, partial [Mucuna pruriens]